MRIPDNPSVWGDIAIAAVVSVISFHLIRPDILGFQTWTTPHVLLAECAVWLAVCLVLLFPLGGILVADAKFDRVFIHLLLIAFTIIVVFARAYAVLGIRDHGVETNDFLTCLYMSLVTFTTLGYGDVTPNGTTRFIATSEALLGYVIMAFLVSVFFTMIARNQAALILKTGKGSQKED